MHLRVGGNKLIATPLAEERERERVGMQLKELDAESFRERERETNLMGGNAPIKIALSRKHVFTVFMSLVHFRFYRLAMSYNYET